jgi:hypothetical protein
MRPGISLSEFEFSWADNAELSRRVDAFAERVPDYQAVLGRAAWVLPGHMEAYLRASRNGPQLGYCLAKQPHLFLAIAGAPSVQGIAMLLSIEREMRHAAAAGSLMQHSITYTFAPTAKELQEATQLLWLFAWDTHCLEAE